MENTSTDILVSKLDKIARHNANMTVVFTRGGWLISIKGSGGDYSRTYSSIILIEAIENAIRGEEGLRD